MLGAVAPRDPARKEHMHRVACAGQPDIPPFVATMLRKPFGIDAAAGKTGTP